MTDIGPHLLGRLYKEDERDIPMAKALEAMQVKTPLDPPTNDILDKTVREVLDEGKYFSSWRGILTFWRWIKNLFNPPAPTPTPTPTPTPSVTTQLWNLDDFLDQGNTGHCVGFGWTGEINAAPNEHNFDNAYAHAYYYDCKIVDGEPGAENGSYVRSGAKVGQNRGLLKSYVFSTNVDEIITWVLNHGPVVMGTNWYNDMFNPDPNGFVTPTGSLAGGHCFVLIGYDSGTGTFTFQNSWGKEWGVGGRFKMTTANFSRLLSQRATEACAPTEIDIAQLL